LRDGLEREMRRHISGDAVIGRGAAGAVLARAQIEAGRCRHIGGHRLDAIGPEKPRIDADMGAGRIADGLMQRGHEGLGATGREAAKTTMPPALETSAIIRLRDSGGIDRLAKAMSIGADCGDGAMLRPSVRHQRIEIDRIAGRVRLGPRCASAFTLACEPSTSAAMSSARSALASA
jgi:hypothetical protein